MLNPAKASSTALLSAARSHFDKRQYAEAERYIHEILRRDINDPAGLAVLAEIYVTRGKVKDAVSFYMSAIRSDPSELLYKERFIELGGSALVAGYEELTELALVECLKTADKLDVSRMQPLWSIHVVAHPEFDAAYGLLKRKNFDPANRVFFEGLSNFKPLFRPCFLTGIRYLSAHTPVFEEFITHIRRHLLMDYCGERKKFTPEERIALAVALSHLCFREDYILDCTAEEQEKVDALRAWAGAGEKAAGDAAGIAILACYAPLYTLENAAEIARRFSAFPDIADVVSEQITDYEELRRTEKEIVAITEIDDAVSLKVREQYEEFPYPQWKYFSAGVLLRSSSRNDEIEGPLRGKKIKILIAGCGTGQEAVLHTALFPGADILAVDLSRASLAYGVNRARSLGIRNVTFRQADILHLGSLGQKFDYISVSGVLHHMGEPVKGWKVLCGLLKPDGLMQVSLYSKAARWAITRTREVIRQGGYGHDRAGMKAFRRNSINLLERPVLDGITAFSDYYNMGMYRDLLFHVQEHCYDLPEIGSILRELGLEFATFCVPASVKAEYDRRFPDDPKRGNLDNWRRLEEENPAVFRSMYSFWCRKKKD